MNLTKHTFDSGLQAIFAPVPGSPSVTVLVMAHTGSEYESEEKAGLSHFLEHMCFKGTEKYPSSVQVSLELDRIGSQSNAFTMPEMTGYYAKAHPMHLSKIIDLMSQIYIHPSLEAAEAEKEKGVIIEEINRDEDRPDRKVYYVFNEALFGANPAGHSILGTKESVSAMTRQDLLDYKARHYVASGTTVIVAGNFDQDAAMREISLRFAALPESPKQAKLAVSDTQTEPVVKFQYKDTDQTHLVIGVRTFPAKDSRGTALKVLSNVLSGGFSSRLFQKLREEMGVGYHVYSDVEEYSDHGCFTVSAGVDSSRVEEVVHAILSEMNKLAAEPVPEDELQKTKDYMIGNMYLGLESSDAVAEYYAVQDILTGETTSVDELADRIRGVTSDDIQKVAQDIMRDDRLNMALIGNMQDGEILKKIFHF
jgi:predicted Zn-dependent peptidase